MREKLANKTQIKTQIVSNYSARQFGVTKLLPNHPEPHMTFVVRGVEKSENSIIAAVCIEQKEINKQ